MKLIIKRTMCMLISLASMLTIFLSPALAVTEQNVAPPGSPDFISLSNYITPTAIPDVYEVTMMIEPPGIVSGPTSVFVAVTLDASGSMVVGDILDQKGLYNTTQRSTDPLISNTGPVATRTNQWITRYEALELAVDALVQQLASTGNPNIYLNLSSHVRQSVFITTGLASARSGGFVKIFDASGNVIPELRYDNGLNPQWILKDWEYIRLANSTVVPAGTPSIMEKRWGGYNDNDVGMAFQLRNQEFTTAIRSGLIGEEDSRFILAMGGGIDSSMNKTGNMLGNGAAGATFSTHNYNPGTVNTQRFALGLKAPIDPNFLTNTPGVATPIVGLNTVTKNGAGTTIEPLGGVGANIWGVIVGRDVLRDTNNAWKSDFVSSVNGSGFTSLAEYSMIADTLVLPASYNIPAGIIGGNGMNDYINDIKPSLSSPLIQTSASPADNTVNYYRSMALEPILATTSTLYDDKDALLGVFANFGQAAVDAAGGGGNIQVVADLNMNPLPGHSFEFYDYPGIGKLTMATNDYTFDPSDPSSSVEMFAKIEGNSIIWDQNIMRGGYFYRLSFFIKYDGPDLEEGQVLKIFNEAYITYKRDDGTVVVKKFPTDYFDPNMNPAVDDGEKSEDIFQYAGDGTGIMINIGGNMTGNQTAGNVNVPMDENSGIILLFPANATASVNQGSHKRLKANKEPTIIYQKSASGKYKAVAKVSKGRTFTLIDEGDGYYKILFMKKGSSKASVGYIKTSDAILS